MTRPFEDPFDEPGMDEIVEWSKESSRLQAEAEAESEDPAPKRKRRRKKNKAHSGAPIEKSADVPEIMVSNRDECDVAEDVRAALRFTATIYSYGDTLVEYHEGRMLQAGSSDEVRELLSRVMRFRKAAQDGIRAAPVPEPVIKAIRARPPHDLQKLSSLAIIEQPVITPSGDVISTEQYYPDGQVYVRPNLAGFTAPAETPTEIDVCNARALINELLCDFPFAENADKTHAVALLLAPVVQHIIAAPQPLFIVESATPGTGKGKLVHCAGIVSDGKALHARSLGEGYKGKIDELEFAKQLTAAGKAGERWVWFDNVRARIDSGVLAKATVEGHMGRVLGYSKSIELRAKDVIFVVSGNNLSLHGEIARRALRVRLIAPCERPDEREGFRHSPLEGWVRSNRGRILSALYALVRHWFASGQPAGTGAIGSYESWSRVVGGILQAAGYTDFLGNRSATYEDADEELADWREFCSEWWTEYGGRDVQAHDLHRIAGQTLPAWWLGGGSEAEQVGRLGRLLNKRRDRYFGKYKIAKGDRAEGRRLFALIDTRLAEQTEAPF